MGYEKEKQREYQLEWMKSRREAWIASQGGKCVECGAQDNLEVDHIDPSLKTMHAAHLWSRKESVRLAELANCQVLCYTCHKAKTRSEQFTVTHGDYGMYKRHGCRCEACRAANALRRARQRLAA